MLTTNLGLIIYLLALPKVESVSHASSPIRVEVQQWEDGASYGWIVENGNLLADKANWDLFERFLGRMNDGLNRTLLHWGVHFGATKFCKHLLEGRDSKRYRQLLLVSTTTEAETPLHWAVLKKQPALVGMFVRYGADLEATRFDGRTALLLAPDVETASLLIQLGANYRHRDVHGERAIDLAVKHHKRDLYLYLSSVMRYSDSCDASLAGGIQRMPNIEYLGRAYNVIFGDPHAAAYSSRSADPGFTGGFVFDLSATASPSCNLTFDQKWAYPDYADIIPATGCSLSIDSTIVTGAASYQQSSSRQVSSSNGKSVGFEYDGFGASVDMKFTASEGFNKATKSMQNSGIMYFDSQVPCSIYIARLKNSLLPALSRNFQSAVRGLPDEQNAQEYKDFISNYGTHYVSSIIMGSLQGLVAKYTFDEVISKMDYSSYVSSGENAEAYALRAVGVKVRASHSNSASSGSGGSHSSLQSSESSRDKYYSMGAQLPANKSINAWKISVAENPVPIHIKLDKLSDLLSSNYFPDDDGIATKQANLISTYQRYCQILLASRIVTSCDQLPRDKPLPIPCTPDGYYCGTNCGVCCKSSTQSRCCAQNGDKADSNDNCCSKYRTAGVCANQPPVSCGNPPGLDNGWVFSGNTNIGASRDLWCDDGYRLTERKTITCQQDGTWSQLGYCHRRTHSAQDSCCSVFSGLCCCEREDGSVFKGGPWTLRKNDECAWRGNNQCRDIGWRC